MHKDLIFRNRDKGIRMQPIGLCTVNFFLGGGRSGGILCTLSPYEQLFMIPQPPPPHFKQLSLLPPSPCVHQRCTPNKNLIIRIAFEVCLVTNRTFSFLSMKTKLIFMCFHFSNFRLQYLQKQSITSLSIYQD